MSTAHNTVAVRRETRSTPEFDALFERYFDPLTRQVARMVECEHVAEELVQDVFLRMWSGRDALDVRGEFSSYLRRAARNRALDWLRHQHLHRQWEQMAAHDGMASVDSHAEDDDLRRVHEALSECLAQMPARRRVVCELKWRDDLGPSAIAARLGISVKTVEAHITIGAKALRARLQGS
jgi:RNA polymerase sigma-70 factor (ECF subfamily)